MLCDEEERVEHVPDGGGVGEVGERDSGVAGAEHLVVLLLDELRLEGGRQGRVDPEQRLRVRAGAHAAAARLDAEEVVEERDDEVVVQQQRPRRCLALPAAAARVESADGDRKDRQPAGRRVAEDR